MSYRNALIFVAVTAASLQSQSGAAARPGSRTVGPAGTPAPLVAEARHTAEPMRIDGRADESVWRDAAKQRGFRMFEPRVDVDPSFETEFEVAYDDRNLYVFLRMFDPRPDSIMRALSRRDVRGPSDQIKLLISSYDDQRSGYEFAVNPDGVKRDYAMSNDGDEDESWDAIWEAGTTVDSLGWTAEFRIPLSQLRYSKADEHTFGFGIWRDIERLKERSAWPLWSPHRQGIVSQLGRLTGLRGLSSARRMEVTPYIVAKDQKVPGPTFDREQRFTVGGDLKLGLTPNLTLDATVNPDFGQVEADPAVVNLTAFETFFNERRPFFVEGNGFYQFALNCYIVVDCNTNEGLFYSRRIGRSPSLRGIYGDAETATATPIAAATKLTGRTRGGLSFGLLDAITQRVDGILGQTVEPQTNYSVLRANQDLRGGKAGVSLIATATNRALDGLTDPYLSSGAYTAGTTVRSKFGAGDNYEVNGQFAVSRVDGTAPMIARLQRSPVHYYQQPGDGVFVDTTRTSLNGNEAQLKVGKYGGGLTRFETSLVRQSAGFDVNDLGYLRRADLLNWSSWGALSWREAKWIYRWAQLNGNHWVASNTSGTRYDHGVNVNGHMGLRNNWDVHLGGTLANLSNTACDRCTRGGPLLRRSRGFYPWGGVNSDGRKPVQGGMWFNFGRDDEGASHYTSLSPYVNLRFGTQATLGFSAGYEQSVNDAQWFGNFTTGPVTHYSFAHLDQTTVSISVRANYTATPTLSFEFYGAPFVSHGRYSDFKELSATPRADAYADRFVAYVPPPGNDDAFKYAQLRANAVVRWEYQPGSTLFVVWQHGKERFANQFSDRPWTQDYRDLFAQQPDNTFLVKFAYWLSR